MSNKKSNDSRRKLLKSIAAGSGAVVAGKSLPESWSKPVIDTVMLPAHAATTGVDSSSTQEEESCKNTAIIPGGAVKCSDEPPYSIYHLYSFSLSDDDCLTQVEKIYNTEAPSPEDNEFRVHYRKHTPESWEGRMTVNTAQGIGAGRAVDQFCLDRNNDFSESRVHELKIDGVAYTASFTLYRYQTIVSISDITVAPAF